MLKLKGKIPNLTCINKGAWNETATLYFSEGKGQLSSISQTDTGISIEVDSIDNVLGGKRATFIKMDIEGAELMALKGAEKTIKTHKPKLAICVYHKKEDLLTIPQYIKSINPDYKLHLRAHSPMVRSFVLYAI